MYMTAQKHVGGTIGSAMDAERAVLTRTGSRALVTHHIAAPLSHDTLIVLAFRRSIARGNRERAATSRAARLQGGVASRSDVIVTIDVHPCSMFPGSCCGVDNALRWTDYVEKLVGLRCNNVFN